MKGKADEGRKRTFPTATRTGPIHICEDGLFIDDEAVILKINGQFYPRLARKILSPQDQNDAMRRLNKIGQLLDQGRVADAIFAATMQHRSLRSDSSNLIRTANKANFNPAEPRDERGWWSKSPRQDKASFLLEDVQYRGYFHDIVVNQFIRDLIDGGGEAIKNIDVVVVNGVLAIPDGGSVVTGKKEPFFIEVKTGFDPEFTRNQRQVYPLICLGGRAVSVDPRIRRLGLTPGIPLPPMDIMIVHTYGPGLPYSLESYCKTNNY